MLQYILIISDTEPSPLEPTPSRYREALLAESAVLLQTLSFLCMATVYLPSPPCPYVAFLLRKAPSVRLSVSNPSSLYGLQSLRRYRDRQFLSELSYASTLPGITQGFSRHVF